jgi:hypothetical protein
MVGQMQLQTIQQSNGSGLGPDAHIPFPFAKEK